MPKLVGFGFRVCISVSDEPNAHEDMREKHSLAQPPTVPAKDLSLAQEPPDDEAKAALAKAVSSWYSGSVVPS